MAWSTCTNCEKDLAYPTAEQVVAERIECWNCGEKNCTGVTLGEFLGRMEAQIAALNEAAGIVAPEPQPAVPDWAHVDAYLDGDDA